MTAYIAGIYEHPTRFAPDKSVSALHAEVAYGVLKDAGLYLSEVDGYFCAGDAPGIGPMSMVEYLGIHPRYVDSTDLGGGSPIAQVAEAAQAISQGKCDVALITLAGRPRAEGQSPAALTRFSEYPENEFELHFSPALVSRYAMCAQRHMYEYGTTSEQLAWIRVAASHHAQHNPDALHRNLVSVEDVISSPLISDPLHRLDCCVVSDGGGAVIVVREEIARSLARPLVSLKGAGMALGYKLGTPFDITRSVGIESGAAAYREAGVSPDDIRYLSTYDSFTITVLMALEDLGFCPKGAGGEFVTDGSLISGNGRLAVNTDGGGLCSNHPAHRGGITKIIEAVRQLRGDAHPAVQLPDLALAMAHGTGGTLDQRQGCATIILERE